VSALDVPPVIWSGGCGMAGQAAGWNHYCFTDTDFNTAYDHLLVDPVVDPLGITVLKPGFYRITFTVLSLGPSTNSVRLLQDGKAFHVVGVQEPGAYPNSWRDTAVEVVWPFHAGSRLAIDVINPGLYAFHGWHTGHHSRVQVQYVGPLP
jgi:hypothetical protein